MDGMLGKVGHARRADGMSMAELDPGIVTRRVTNKACKASKVLGTDTGSTSRGKSSVSRRTEYDIYEKAMASPRRAQR